MTDEPATKTPGQEPEQPGGWHAPATPNPWQQIDKPQQPVAAWKVVALPTDTMKHEPVETGGWHLPKPEDTLFDHGQEIEVKPGAKKANKPPSPEDMIAEIIGTKPAAKPPEDMIPAPEDSIPRDKPADPDLIAPEDMIPRDEGEQASSDKADSAEEAELETLDEDDDEAFSFSELMALQSLGEEGGADITLSESDMTPAERALFAAASEAAAELPAEEAGDDTIQFDKSEGGDMENAADYAARMLQELGEGEAQPSPGTLTDALQSEENVPAAGESAADYAARMLQELGDGGGTAPIAPGGTGPMPAMQQPTPQLSPEEQALAERFRHTEQQVAALRQQYQAGQISLDDLQFQLRQHMILDERDQSWWMMGHESNQWYKFDNASGAWVPQPPPVPLSQQGPRSPLTETGQLDPNDVLAGSLPYLPADDASGTQSSAAGSTQGFDPAAGYQEFTPAPRVDPQATIVGGAAFEDSLPGQEPTIQGMPAVGEQTMVAPSVQGGDFNSLVESAADAAEAPDYDLSAADSPLAREYAKKERSNTLRMVVLALGALIALGIIVAIVSIGGIALWYNNSTQQYTEAIANLPNFQRAFNTVRIFDAEDNLIAELISQEGGQRDRVTLEQISPFLIHAIVSQEGQRFYDDPGFDPIAVARAFLQNLTSGNVVSGASTITQQVARNLILQDQEITAERKINEILVAMEIARQYTKNEILTIYMNEIFLGNQSYGVEAAAQFYFDKSAADLNMAESALLASIISAPAQNDPVVNKDQAMLGMRNTIRLMVETGCLQFQHGNFPAEGPFCIGEEVFVDFQGQNTRLLTIDDNGVIGGLLALQIAEVEVREYNPRASNFEHPHFVNFIQGQVEAQFGPDVMFQRGFSIYTTLIPRIQNTAEEALRNQVDALVDNGVNTGAVMVTDPQTGAIRALVGSPDFSNEEIAGQVDNTRTWQQPGSAIKPVVYTASLQGPVDRYLTPISILWDVPSPYNINGVSYNPVNFDRRYHGPTSMRFALQNSYNVAAVKALDYIGTERFVNTANAMGINFLPEAQFGLPSAVGANEVRLIDMMRTFGTLANGGQFQELYAIERITETVDGQQIEVTLPERPEPRQAVSPQAAFVMQNILSDDNARREQFGINSNLTLTGIGIPTQNVVAAKTGTSNDSRDLWTMGFTRNAVVGVWLGTFDNAPTFNTTGFLSAAPVWNQVMRAAMDGRPVQEFQNPGGVVLIDVCLDTGTQAGPECANRTRDFAIQGFLPPPADQGFVQNISVDSWTGLIANEFCPDNVAIETFANIEDPFAVDWLNSTSAGQAYAQRIGLPLPLRQAPQEACSQGTQLPTVALSSPTENQTLTGTVTVMGQVNAGANFSRYQLEYAPISSPNNFVQIGNPSTNQVPGSASLGTWDTTLVPNGGYVLRLIVFSNTGGSIQRTVTVNVSNAQPTATPPPVQQQIPTPAPLESTPLPFDALNPTATATLDPAG